LPVRKIETELTLGGEKAFNDAMKSANSNLKTLKSDMAAVSSEFRKNENSVQALTAKLRIQRDQYKQQQEVVRALTERLKAVEEAYGKDSAQADKLRQQLNAATVAMNKAEDALNETNDALEHQGSLFNSLSQKATAAGKTVANVADGAVKSFSNIAKAAGVLSAVGTAAVGGVAAIGAAAITTLTNYATDAGQRAKTAYDTANDLAEKAREAFLHGNEEAGMEYLRQANELIDGIDQQYLQFGMTLERLEESSTAAKDALGKILLPALQDLSEEGAALLESFSAEMEAAAGDTERQGEIIAEYVRRAVELIRDAVPEFTAIAVDLLEGLAQGVDDNLDTILNAALTIVNTLLDTITAHAGDIGSGAAELINQLADFLIDHGPDLLAAGAELVINIIAGLVEHLPELISKIAELPGELFKAFTEADVDWGSIGSNIVAGIAEGFSQMWNDFVNNVQNSFNSLVNSVSNFLGIASPSKLFRDRIGKNMAAGVGVGWENEMQTVSRDMQQSLDDAMPDPPPDPIPFPVPTPTPAAGAAAFNASVSASSGSRGDTVTNLGGVTLIINGYNVQDDESMAELLSYKLQEILDRRSA